MRGSSKHHGRLQVLFGPARTSNQSLYSSEKDSRYIRDHQFVSRLSGRLLWDEGSLRAQSCASGRQVSHEVARRVRPASTEGRAK